MPRKRLLARRWKGSSDWGSNECLADLDLDGDAGGTDLLILQVSGD